MTSCSWREQLEIEGGERVPLPGINQTDGWAAPGVNFAGPGWRSTFRMRPTTMFDLAAKIHDLAFVLNELSIRFTLADREQPSLSLKAKADAIFRIMTQFSRDHDPDLDPAAFLYRNVANAIFDGNDPSAFRRGDGFRNPLLEPDTLAYLNDPKHSLTIPYDQIGGERPRRTVEVKGRDPYTYTTADYMTEVSMDTSPGFWAWFQQTYAPVLEQILSIDAGAGSEDC